MKTNTLLPNYVSYFLLRIVVILAGCTMFAECSGLAGTVAKRTNIPHLNPNSVIISPEPYNVNALSTLKTFVAPAPNRGAGSGPPAIITSYSKGRHKFTFKYSNLADEGSYVYFFHDWSDRLSPVIITPGPGHENDLIIAAQVLKDNVAINGYVRIDIEDNNSKYSVYLKLDTNGLANYTIPLGSAAGIDPANIKKIVVVAEPSIIPASAAAVEVRMNNAPDSIIGSSYNHDSLTRFSGSPRYFYGTGNLDPLVGFRGNVLSYTISPSNLTCSFKNLDKNDFIFFSYEWNTNGISSNTAGDKLIIAANGPIDQYLPVQLADADTPNDIQIKVYLKLEGELRNYEIDLGALGIDPSKFKKIVVSPDFYFPEGSLDKVMDISVELNGIVDGVHPSLKRRKGRP